MKKLTLTGLVAAGVLLTTACSEDNTFQPQPGEGGNVTFTIQLPAEGLGSRAFADGLTADDLEYAVYDKETKTLVGKAEKVQFGNALQTTVSLNLANGKSYSIAFFAHKKDQNVYTFNADTKTITVDYDAMSDHNATDNDCFYNLYETGVVKGAINETVTLTRPVAQINWGTSDIEAASVVAEDMYGAGAGKLVSKVSVTNAYTTLDMFTGDVVEGETAVVALPYLERPDNTENVFPANTQETKYEYISAHYLLAPKSSSAVIDLKLEIANDAATTAKSEVVVTNAPYQANYRTNIYGALLTSPANFTVEKEPNFEKPDYDNGYKSVSTAEDLTAAIEAGIPVKLAEDITLNNAIELPSTTTTTINLNGHKITAEGKDQVFRGGDLILDDEAGRGEVFSEAKTVIDVNKFTLNGGRIYTTLNFEVGNSEPTGNGNKFSIPITGTEIIINGGEIGNENYPGGGISAKKVVVNGGRFISNGKGIAEAYIWLSDDIEINGGTFGTPESSTFIVGTSSSSPAGNVVINGGTFYGGAKYDFTCMGLTEEEVEAKFGDNIPTRGMFSARSGCFKITINGGDFYGDKVLYNNYDEMIEVNPSNYNTYKQYISVQGGNWQVGDVENYIPADYKLIENGQYNGKPVYAVSK